MPTLQGLLSYRFRAPASPISEVAADGVRLAGSRVGDPSPERPALVSCHGLMGWHRKPRFARFSEAMTPWFTVYTFDFRGHGDSGGVSTYGDREIDDVQAMVELARTEGHRRVATMGTSMGAIAVLRHAGIVGGVDQVVAISSLARWGSHHAQAPNRERPWRRMRALTDTARGREVLRAYGVRLPSVWDPPESPEDVVGKIAPTPILIVHGRDDHLFGDDEALRLFERAGEPRRLLVADRFGHAEDGLSPAFARRVARGIYEAWSLPWPG